MGRFTIKAAVLLLTRFEEVCGITWRALRLLGAVVAWEAVSWAQGTATAACVTLSSGIPVPLKLC